MGGFGERRIGRPLFDRRIAAERENKTLPAVPHNPIFFATSKETKPMPSGGKRNGSGRPKGAISLAMRDVLSAASQSGEMPIAYMLRVMRNEKVRDARRDEMAKAAATYLHTKLSSIPSELEDELEPVFQ
jgi:hypothetical protein